MLILSQNIAQLESQVEKATRERMSTMNQLEELQDQLTSQDKDATQVQTDSSMIMTRWFLWNSFSKCTKLLLLLEEA